MALNMTITGEELQTVHDAYLQRHNPYTGGTGNCGAAVSGRCLDGAHRIFRGTTLQNCAYPNSLCAVQNALTCSIIRGIASIDRIVLFARQVSSPGICGRCLQLAATYGSPATEIAILWTDDAETLALMERADPAALTRLSKKLYTLESLSVYTIFPSTTKHGLVREEPWKAPIELAQYKLAAGQADLEEEDRWLVDAAWSATLAAFIPLSHFPVGAAVLTKSGEIFTGANIECPSGCGLGICAERATMAVAMAYGSLDNEEREVALTKSAKSGHSRDIKKVAVVTLKAEEFASPCGGCRQSIVESGDDVEVIQVKPDHANKTFEVRKKLMKELLFGAFTPESLK